MKWDTYPSPEHEAEDQLARTHAIEYAGTLIFDLNRLVKRLRKTDDYQPDAQDAGNLETNLAQLRVNMAILETSAQGAQVGRQQTRRDIAVGMRYRETWGKSW